MGDFGVLIDRENSPSPADQRVENLGRDRSVAGRGAIQELPLARCCVIRNLPAAVDRAETQEIRALIICFIV